MVTYHSLLNEGKRRLYDAGSTEQAAMLLLTELCRHKDINLYMELDEQADDEVKSDYLEALVRMEAGEPLSYVLGYESFYGYDFTVNENVLIPRPETEELVGLVLSLFDEHFGDRDSAIVFDVATGSGAIGVSLSLEEDRMDVFASDISQEALDVAAFNNRKLGGRTVFLQGSMLDPFIDRNMHCDLLVCNPPYIPRDEELESSVRDYEPHVALFGGSDGLKFYREVFEKADQVMNPGGVLAFEMGYDQGERLSALAREHFPEARIQVHKDLSGKDRMLSIEL